jgi:hypothetical protein
MKTNYYHYTPLDRLEELIESGIIKLATASVLDVKREKPCAWVSTNPHWENTATKLAIDKNGNKYQLTFNEQVEIFGCARIQVKPFIGLINWGKLKHIAKMNLQYAKVMEEVGVEKGASPKEWFGSLKPITIEYWIKAEIYKDGEWIEYRIFNQ